MELKYTKQAEKEIDEILEYSIQHFGFERAEKYILTLKKTCEFLSVNPHSGRQRMEFTPPSYTIPSQKHIIFYQINDDHILIESVVHSSRDWLKSN
jgi:toxin ParE1/3/4